jgi:hypothetical protein
LESLDPVEHVQSQRTAPFSRKLAMFRNFEIHGAYSVDPDQPFQPIVITDSGDPDHGVHRA